MKVKRKKKKKNLLRNVAQLTRIFVSKSLPAPLETATLQISQIITHLMAVDRQCKSYM